MCQAYQATNVDSGTYTVQTDEWDSSATQCVSTTGGAGFTVTKSAIANSADGDPGSYPSIYAGCNWGACTQAGLAANPQQVSSLGPGDVTTSLATTDPAGGAYDVSYDIWFNKSPTTSGAPNGLEVMIWLNHAGGVQPAGTVVQSNAQLGGYTYDIWYSSNAGNGPCVTYEMTTPTSSVSNLDLSSLFSNAEQNGILDSSWYLIAVEAGFEIWQGGAGLAVNGFSVALGQGQ
jgi:Glycosyl hydrolase family 12